MAKTITIGDIVFEKKSDAVEYFKRILYSYDLGDRVSTEHALILNALVDNHPDRAEKIGCGIQSFSVRSAEYGTRCFWINRTDQTTEKFSFRSCLN